MIYLLLKHALKQENFSRVQSHFTATFTATKSLNFPSHSNDL